MTMGPGGTPADWYADPSNPQQMRYWDGNQWTEHVSAAPAAEPDPEPMGTFDLSPAPAAVAAPSGRSRVPLVVLLVVAALAAGFGAGYYVGSDDAAEPAAVVPRQTGGASPTKADAVVDERTRTLELKSTLKSAATAQEVYFTDYSTYTKDVKELVKAGLVIPPKITLTVTSASDKAHCMKAVHADAPAKFWYISAPPTAPNAYTGEPTQAPCT